MRAKLIIISPEVKNRAIEIIRALPLDVIHSVEVKEHKRNRSAEANALYWQWLTIIGNELGESKEDVHERYKSDYLVHIYERDDPEYSAMLQALRDIWRQGMKAEAAGLRKKIVHLTSTTTATTAQMSEYMDSIARHAASLAIRLPFPDDD